MTPRAVPVAAIAVGERDREEMGDINALAESIRAVGLLHPVVVTESLTLVAGGRRLDAARSLGWTEVPVTVVDLSTVADALRAEADENTQRKPLTPYEAARARERRAKVLAEDAKRRQGTRTDLQLSANLAEGSTSRSRQLEDERPVAKVPQAKESARPTVPMPTGTVSPKPAERETRKAAAVGTGYSGSTLDKVDKIRAIAEQGVVPIGRGKERREEPVPPPVQEVAKRALEDVKKTGAAVDSASKSVERALREYVEADPDVQAASYRSEVAKAVSGVRSSLLTLDPSRVAEVMSDFDRLDTLRADINAWFDQLNAGRRTATVLPFARSN